MVVVKRGGRVKLLACTSLCSTADFVVLCYCIVLVVLDLDRYPGVYIHIYAHIL